MKVDTRLELGTKTKTNNVCTSLSCQGRGGWSAGKTGHALGSKGLEGTWREAST